MHAVHQLHRFYTGFSRLSRLPRAQAIKVLAPEGWVATCVATWLLVHLVLVDALVDVPAARRPTDFISHDSA
jgi:hypothetical protein